MSFYFFGNEILIINIIVSHENVIIYFPFKLFKMSGFFLFDYNCNVYSLKNLGKIQKNYQEDNSITCNSTDKIYLPFGKFPVRFSLPE